MKTNRKIDMLIIHCSATKPTMDIGVKEIRKWHVEGNGWQDIGYHDVIRRNGNTERGRPYEIAGAHVAGKNSYSIGVCLVGGVDDNMKPDANFTDKQWKTLAQYVRAFKAEYPRATIHGHNEFSSKDCPSFNVEKWLKKEGL